MRCAACLLLLLVSGAYANPAIDMPGYLAVSREAAEHRATRRVSEEDFIRMSREPGNFTGAADRSRPRSRAPRSTSRRTLRASKLEFERR
jgi:hypothetical protein